MAAHAQVLLFIRHADRISELPLELRVMRIMAHRAGNRLRRRRGLLDVVVPDVECEQRALSGMTPLTRGIRRRRRDHLTVSRLRPFLHKWMVNSRVAFAAATIAANRRGNR